MDCKKITSQLTDYFYNDLSPENTALAENHLEHCKKCQALYKKMSAVLSSASLHSNVSANDYIATRIIAKLGNKLPTSARVRLVQYFLRPALVISLVVLGIFTGIKISNTYTENLSNTYIVADTKSDLARQFASENYLTTPNDEYIEMYLNEKK